MAHFLGVRSDDVFGLTQVLMETNEANVVQATYSYGNGLISMNRADVNSYYLYDGLGSTRQLTDSSQAVVASYTYDGFGNLIVSSGSVANTYGFTGQQQFSEADGLEFLRARYYKPAYGRFISRDPIGYKGGLNIYTYCRNNPINRIDPKGLACEGQEHCFEIGGAYICPEQPSYSQCTECCDYMANHMAVPPLWHPIERCYWWLGRATRLRDCYTGCDAGGHPVY